MRFKTSATVMVTIFIGVLSFLSGIGFAHTRFHGVDKTHDHPNIFIGNGFDTHDQKYVFATGSGWFPSETLEIWAISIPEADDKGHYSSSSTEWTKLGTVVTDQFGMLGAPVKKVFITTPLLCGAPPQGIPKPLFKVQDPNLAMVAFSSGDDAPWFTFDPCH